MNRHVAVIKPHYLDRILAGEKTVEARVTRVRCAPHGAVRRGDEILFKQSAGPYRARATAARIEHHADLTPARLRKLARDMNPLVHATEDFWRQRRHARYATFIWLQDVRPIARGPAIPPLYGRAWLTLARNQRRAA